MKWEARTTTKNHKPKSPKHRANKNKHPKHFTQRFRSHFGSRPKRARKDTLFEDGSILESVASGVDDFGTQGVPIFRFSRDFSRTHRFLQQLRKEDVEFVHNVFSETMVCRRRISGFDPKALKKLSSRHGSLMQRIRRS